MHLVRQSGDLGERVIELSARMSVVEITDRAYLRTQTPSGGLEVIPEGLGAEFDGGIGLVNDASHWDEAMDLSRKTNVLRGHARGR